MIEALGTTDASIYVLMAVTLYYGILMLDRGNSDPGEIILVVLAMLFGGATVGQAFQQIDHFNFAISAAKEIFPTIDRVILYMAIPIDAALCALSFHSG